MTIAYHEHLGYRALEQGENPHAHFQYAEYLKREKHEVDDTGRRLPKGGTKKGQNLSRDRRPYAENQRRNRKQD